MNTRSGAAGRGRGGARGAGAGAGGGGRLSSDSAGASSTSLLHLRGASTSSGSGGLGGSGAGEVASGGSAILLDVVLVESESKFLLGGAHAVGTVLASSGVGIEAVAASETANGAEELGVLAGGKRVGDNTCGGIVHAFAEVDIGTGGERRGLGGPLGANGRTALEGGVGGCVGSLVRTGGVDAGDLAGVVLEVGHGADTGAVDYRNKT